MKNLLILSIVASLLLLIRVDIFSQATPPALFIDKGACPFECCVYRKWKTEKTTVAYARPDKRSKRIGKFVSGTNVTAMTGEVRTIPSKFLVKKEHENYKPGDIIWVYTYYGEGYFKVWFKGKMYDEELDFSSYGGSSGNRCEASEQCWGELDKELQMTWWVKIKSPKGWVGWTNQPENFSGADECG